ncbi:hypothetical protein CFter6_0429 [Collimonas fungivorans]|uniref:Uncharacterized protein n=2 Tax=Collimonas TaxID=202907 RepID=A0A127PYF3_9BURK|nr:hypothetical protein CFter6_0429 [Collimonas fungivorans]AMP02821.1 hypothetical protein CPter91_0422 [Collimonas pratensis]
MKFLGMSVIVSSHAPQIATWYWQWSLKLDFANRDSLTV